MKTNMKTLIASFSLGLILLTVTPERVFAQDVEVSGFYGYQLHGTARLYDGDFFMQDAPSYGGRIAVGLSTTTFAEITYLRSDTEGTFSPFIGAPSDRIPFSSNYIQIGGLQGVDMGRFFPYGTLSMGLTIWDPKSSLVNTKVQFSAILGAGFKLWLTDFLGIRAQASMLMPMVVNGFGFGCGIGTGGSSCGTNLYTRITPFGGEFSGGIIIRISNN